MHTSLVRHLLFHFTFPPTTEIYTLSLHDALPVIGTFQGIKTRNSSRCHNEKQGCYLQKEMGRPSLFCRSCGMACISRSIRGGTATLRILSSSDSRCRPFFQNIALHL